LGKGFEGIKKLPPKTGFDDRSAIFLYLAEEHLIFAKRSFLA
jgi:hypothetical protein